MTQGVFIDLKKAFDTMSLKKLERIRITGTAFKMKNSHLTNRHQIVKIGNCHSSPKLLKCGISQGSILGPLLFLVYVNNIYQTDIKGHPSQSVDDTCIFYFGNNVNFITDQTQEDIDKLHR